MGVPKRRVSHARQGERRAHLAIEPAEARGVPALPRAEAAASRLPELRLLQRPAGHRAQARRRRRRALIRGDGAAVRTRPRRGRGVRVAVDAMGGDHGPAEVVPGALDLRPRAPRRPAASSSATRRSLTALAGALPANVTIVHASPGHRHGRAPGARPAREEGRLDPRRHATSSSAARPTRSSPPVTPAPGWPPRSCASAACPASTGRPSPSR